MNMLKRTAAALLSVALLLPLAACGKTPAEKPETNPATDTGTATAPVEPPLEASYTYRLLDTSNQYHFYEITATYEGADHPFMIRVPIVEDYSLDPEAAAERMDPQIELLNQMAASSANVNVWLYVATCLEDSAIMLDIAPTEYLGSNLPYFTSKLDERIWVGSINPKDIKERNELYFATDHHWNTDGWYKAYNELISAMSAKYSDMIPARTGELHLTDASYFGSIARDNMGSGYKDAFSFYDFALPTHETVVLKVKNNQKNPNGKKLYASAVPCADNMAKYLDGTFNTDEMFDHYVNFYPICDTVTYPENTTGRNMLFIGDSFSLAVQELIASHFDNSYFFYSDGTAKLFKGQDFTAFCKDNAITDVVILEQSTRILYDFYDYSGPALASFTVSD